MITSPFVKFGHWTDGGAAPITPIVSTGSWAAIMEGGGYWGILLALTLGGCACG